MLQYVVRRLVYGAVTLLALSIIVFTLLQNTGGGPLDRLKANPRIRAEDIQRIDRALRPGPAGGEAVLHVGAATTSSSGSADAWGESFQGDGQVRDIIADRVMATLRLMLTSLGLAVLIGIPLGVFQALRQYSFFDQAGTTFSFITFSMPIFVLAVTLQLLLAVYLERWTGVKFFFNAGHELLGLRRPRLLGPHRRHAVAPVPAGHLDRPDLDRRLLPLPAGVDARRAAQRLPAHRQGQGPVAADGDREARPAQRPHPHRHPGVARRGGGAGRGRDHRVDLRVARASAASTSRRSAPTTTRW